MTTDYTIWYRDPHQLFLNILQNPDFATTFDYAPLREYDKDGNRQYKNFMSGDWAWKQAVCKILLTKLRMRLMRNLGYPGCKS